MEGVARDGVEPSTFRFSVGRSYQLSYLAWTLRLAGEQRTAAPATPTGLEPAASAVTGRRANQLRYGANGPEGPVELSCRRTVERVPPTGFEPVLPP